MTPQRNVAFGVNEWELRGGEDNHQDHETFEVSVNEVVNPYATQLLAAVACLVKAMSNTHVPR